MDIHKSKIDFGIDELDIQDPVYVNDYLTSIDKPDEFWGSVGHLVDWDRPWEQVLDCKNPPFTKWFKGGYINACFNAVDRHVLHGNGNKIALIHDSPLTATIRHVTYDELLRQVTLFAGGLSKLGVCKGDRVLIYMPLIPEAIIAMLATVRLGAIHSVVFGGFAPNELCTRIDHAEPKIIIAANCGVEPGKVIQYLDILHAAEEMSNWKPDCNIIFQREKLIGSTLNPKLDVCWKIVCNLSEGADCVPVEANEPLYILYTSGTTDKPKGIQRPTGGYLVMLMHTLEKLYGLRQSDVWWNASDLGWVVGHSYICYGPLLFGSTSVMYEGKPDRTPDPGQYFRIIDQHKVSALFSVPTAFRVLRRVDPDCVYGRKYSLNSLRTIFIAGEHCDTETKSWIEKIFRVPVLNHWWQTETGSAITATCLRYRHSLNPPKYSTGLPYLGYKIKIVQPDGSECLPLQLGRIIIQLPLPPGNMSTLYKNDELFQKTYFKKFPGYYDTMDAGYKDENGYVFVTARDDDVINVAGHRISTLSLEDAILRHPDVVDAAVFGVPEPTKGQVPLCLYIPREGTLKTDAKLSAELIKLIRDVIGPIASFRLAAPVKALPRTRSGKTLRKAMADFAKNELFRLPSTIEDASVFLDIRRALQQLGYAMNTPNLDIFVNQ